MDKIKLNNQEFEISNFVRTNNFEEGSLDYIDIDVVNFTEANIEALAGVPITSIQIYRDNELIYNLDNISATINNFTESLDNSGIISSIHMVYSNV